MFRLYIKGSIPECLAEIKCRGLIAIGCVNIDRYLCCAIDVESCNEYLMTWYDEADEHMVDVKFPSGTLLTILKHRSYTKPLAELV